MHLYWGIGTGWILLAPNYLNTQLMVIKHREKFLMQPVNKTVAMLVFWCVLEYVFFFCLFWFALDGTQDRSVSVCLCAKYESTTSGQLD